MLQVKSESQIMTSMLSETLDVVREIRAKLEESAPPTSTNSAMLEIALVLREFLVASECEDSVGGNILINRTNAVIAQLQQ